MSSPGGGRRGRGSGRGDPSRRSSRPSRLERDDCARCGEEINATADVCLHCGNNPFLDVLKILIGVGVLLLIPTLLFPPMLIFSVVFFTVAGLLYVIDLLNLDYQDDDWKSPTEKDYSLLGRF